MASHGATRQVFFFSAPSSSMLIIRAVPVYCI
jgi:hypothetical protein